MCSILMNKLNSNLYTENVCLFLVLSINIKTFRKLYQCLVKIIILESVYSDEQIKMKSLQKMSPIDQTDKDCKSQSYVSFCYILIIRMFIFKILVIWMGFFSNSIKSYAFETAHVPRQCYFLHSRIPLYWYYSSIL